MGKQGLILDKVVLLGRTFDEYSRYFALDAAALKGRAVLDVASGVSSFCAEANGQGIHVTAFDPIYDLPPKQIEAGEAVTLDGVAQGEDVTSGVMTTTPFPDWVPAVVAPPVTPPR